MLTIWPTHPVFLLLFWSFWRNNSNCFIYFWCLFNWYDIRLWEMQLISKWSTYTALISVNCKEELVLFLHFFFSFLYFCGQHWTILEISWGPEKNISWLRGKKSKTKEKYICRVKYTVLIKKPPYTEDQDTMRTKLSCLSHLSQFILCSSSAFKSSRLFEEQLLLLDLGSKG